LETSVDVGDLRRHVEVAGWIFAVADCLFVRLGLPFVKKGWRGVALGSVYVVVAGLCDGRQGWVFSEEDWLAEEVGYYGEEAGSSFGVREMLRAVATGSR